MFCRMYNVSDAEYYIDYNGALRNAIKSKKFPLRHDESDKNVLPDIATADAVLALCQLIQLRNAFNGDWVPDWSTNDYKFMIEFINGDIIREESSHIAASPLYFKTMELRDEFFRYFRPLIEKLKPLYGIKE